MPVIPIEVQFMILEWVYRLSQSDQIDYSTLASSSLVCQSWSQTAQRLLFRRISDVIDGRRVSISHTLGIICSNPLLGTYVRSLSITAYAPEIGSWYQPNDDDEEPFDSEAALEHLAHCPNLLEFAFFNLVDADPYPLWERVGAEDRLRALKLPVKVLTIGDQPKTVQRLLNIWPSVCHLDTRGTPFRNTDVPPALSGGLCSIHFSLVDATHLAWLLSFNNPESSLREITYHGPNRRNAPILQLVTEPTRKQIRSFTFYMPPPLGLLERLTSVEEIIFNRLPRAAALLPKSVRHVGYHLIHGFDTDTEHDRPLADLIVSLSSLPALQLVTATRCSPQDVLFFLETACRSMDVEFIIYPSRTAFPRARYVDWLWYEI